MLPKSKKRFLNNKKYKKSNLEINFDINRINSLKIIFGALFLLIIIKLFFVQVIDYSEYKKKASNYQDVIEGINAKRGEIYTFSNKDQNINVVTQSNNINKNLLNKIAGNVYKYNLIIDSANFLNFEKLANQLFDSIGNKGLNSKILENKIAEINNAPDFAEKFLEIGFPELYKFKEKEEQKNILEQKKVEAQAKIKSTKNKNTIKAQEKIISDINFTLNFDEETKNGINLLKEEREKIISKINKGGGDHYEIVKKNLEEKQMSDIKKWLEDLYYINFENLVPDDKKPILTSFYKSFINFEVMESRYYSDGNIFGQITGFLALKDNKRNGQYGIEGFYNNDLMGIDGEIKGKYDATGKLITIAEREVKNAQDGVDIILTIDKAIQYTACKELEEAVKFYKAEEGSVLITDPKTNEILGMCNYPNFDPNKYNMVEDIRIYNNSIISDQEEFGSIFKVITTAAGIDTGAISAYSTYEDTGCATIGDWPKPICNADYKTKGARGTTTIVEMLDKSLNVGAYHVASKIGKDIFKDYVYKFGFGEKTGIEFGNEANGDLRNLDKMHYKGGDVYLATASFGQGITFSQIQFMSAFNSIINGGKLSKPSIVKGIIKDGKFFENQPQFIRQTVKEDTSTIMRGMLASVIEKGYDKLAQVDGYFIGGKTGTAQYAEGGSYEGGKTIQSFVGFAPISNPKFSVMIKLKNPETKFASTSCVPVFGKIAKFLLNYYQIPPDKK